jgi:Zn-dependent protease
MGLISLLFSNPLAFIVLAALLLYSVIAHEIAHGWVAYFFGDTTAKYSGRLSLNPLSHLDPMGTIALLVVGFGWAKPVPVNYYNLRNFRLGLFCVSLAGALTNIFIATVALFLLQLQIINPYSILSSVLSLLARINIMLGAFNLIPIPPLDGSKMLMAVLPQEQQEIFLRFESLGFIVLIILLFTGILDPIIIFVQNLILSFIGIFLR